MQAYLIFMAVRLLELQRVLRQEGSICFIATTRPAMAPGLDGRGIRQGDIPERDRLEADRQPHDAGRFGRTGVRLLFYGTDIRRDSVRVPLSEDIVRSKYRHEDRRGRYAITT